MRAAVRGWSALLGALASAVVWTRVALGQAGETPLDLSWDAPAECPDAAAVRADVARLAGAGSRRGQLLKARVRLTKISASTWTLVMATELEGISGERTLTASSCGAVTDAAVLTMALILNPEVEIQTATGGAPTPPLRAPVSSEHAGHPRWSAGSHVGLHAGLLNEPGPELGLGFGLSIGRASASLAADIEMPQNDFTSAKPRAGGRLWGASIGGLACWSLVEGENAIGPCLGVEIDGLHGYGVGVGKPQDGAVFWPAGTLGATMGLRLSRDLTLRLMALGMVSVVRPSLFLEGIGPVDRPAALGGRIYAGIDFAIH
jgi:hypothetical protein